jgi:hypothetical protein
LRALSFTALGLLFSALLITGCGSSGLNSVRVTPTSQSVTAGQTAQFTAIGTYGNAKHSTTQDITSTVTWTSSVPAVATVTASGVATGVTAGTTTITAGATAFNGSISSSATLVVTGTGGGSGGGQILSLTIIPSSITVGNLQDTGQFLAIGTFSTAPTVRDLTNSPTLTWISANPNIFPVNNTTKGSLGATAGTVTAYGSGGSVITAEATNSDGSIQTATTTFNCPLILPNPPTTPGSCFTGSQAAALLATLTVYNEGLNTTNWLVTAPSATGTPNVINCGPAATGGSVCVATYPVGTTVTLTAPATGAAFGGWSYNCANIGTITATGPNSCTTTLTTNDTVGAIFN